MTTTARLETRVEDERPGELGDLTNPTMLVREEFVAELRLSEDTEADQREVAGIVVPYGDTITRHGFLFSWHERFEAGAFDAAGDDVMLFYRHDDPIGLVVEQRDELDGDHPGRWARFRISRTQLGDDVLTLCRDRVLRKFSVGFYPVEHRVEVDDEGTETIVRTKVDLREVSVVPIPAYSGATIDEVRQQAAPVTQSREVVGMPDDNGNSSGAATTVDELRGDVEHLSRRFDVLSAGGAGSAGPALRWRSGGELLKDLLNRAATTDDVALLNRVYAGATTGDSDGARPHWVDAQLKLVEENRPVLDLFTKVGLPAEGMTITYPRVNTATGTVGVQGAEGDDLPYMEVSITDASVPVVTYGGWSSLSRQAIERSTIDYLNTVLRYQALQYAKATNLAGVAAFAAATGIQSTAAMGTWSIMNVVTRLLEAAALVTDNSLGASAEFAVVSGDVFAAIATIPNSDGEPYFAVQGQGAGRYLNVAGLIVKENRRLAPGFFRVGAREAVTVYEQAGAPFRLEDENIINLTKDFSLYGYMAIGRTNPAAIVNVPNALQV